MSTLIPQIKSILEELGFEFQEVSFESIVSSGEISMLGKLQTLPAGDSSKLLENFPDLFVFHRVAPPKKGSFFVKIQEEEKSDPDCDYVYDKYFPKSILLVSSTSSGETVGRWRHLVGKPRPFQIVLKSIIQ